MFTKLPAIKGNIVCLCCEAGSHDVLGMNALLGVGFGDCVVTKDGDPVYSEMALGDEDLWRAHQAEKLASDDPDHDWRIHFHAPLYDATYQRQGEAHWVLVSKGDGFA